MYVKGEGGTVRISFLFVFLLLTEISILFTDVYLYIVTCTHIHLFVADVYLYIVTCLCVS